MNTGKDAAALDAVVVRDAAGPADAADPEDAGDPVDAGRIADATTFPDAASYPDAETPDAEPADAAVIDGGFDCGGLGAACGAQMECPTGLACNTLHMICLPDRAIDCGGFVIAMCPAAQPVCLYFTGSDYGPCFTLPERNCVCATPGGQAAFPDC